eukprot:TRINITY_DN1211_c0_g1_i1.p2 TRINITY_DN1211_c0_g1~~TRINITY_DN1211_c0_g1_i1.p2  ORF type:complete len:131 (+),score=26.02 TRINITY_DN1211_c0_g1_i1:147-539(+)
MGRLFIVKLEGSTYSCKGCQSPLARVDELISKSFHCRNGKAYLFNYVVNVAAGERVERIMTTGLHAVCDIACTVCRAVVGWKYEHAFEKSQKYKEGKFILECEKIVDGDATWRNGGTAFKALMESAGELV